MSDAVTPEQRSELAGEYALGVLEGEELARAESLLAADRAFAEEVALWSGRLAPLLHEIEPVAPPARLLEAIQARVADQQPADNVVHLRRRVTAWRGFALGASAIAASLAMVLVLRPPATQQMPADNQPSAPMVATMQADGSEAKLVATWDQDRQRLVVAAAAGIAPVAGHSHELWVIPADGTPRSIGLLRGAEPLQIRPAAQLAGHFAEGTTLAVSVEPTGGSPTGLPTGPVIAAGKLQST
jgi:anti-sigma-K factor RskA